MERNIKDKVYSRQKLNFIAPAPIGSNRYPRGRKEQFKSSSSTLVPLENESDQGEKNIKKIVSVYHTLKMANFKGINLMILSHFPLFF